MPSLEETLRLNPFGPYPESVLSPECKHTKKAPVILNDLEIILDQKPSGLNFTEILKEDRDVCFVGVLSLHTLKWLTEEGKTTVGRDIEARERLSLEVIYAKKSTIKIVIVGQKRQNVVYIGSKDVPDGLLLVSEASRRFRVESLSGACFRRSQKFLRRWRFLNLIKALSHDISPLPKCGWLMRKMLQVGYAAKFYVEMDTDVEPVFRLHAKWMLKENTRSKKKVIDAPSWQQFLQTPPGEYRFDDSDVEMEDVDPDINTPGRLTRSARKSRSQVIAFSSSSPGPEPQTFPQPQDYMGGSLADEDDYVEDITPPSSPERSPSPPPGGLIDRKILARIPEKYDFVPLIPDSFKWDCDTDLCPHSIDLLNPDKEDLKALTPEESLMLKRKRWNLSDDKMRDIFAKMVHAHRIEHLRSWNIGLRETGFPPLYWIEPPFNPPPKLDKDKNVILPPPPTTYAILSGLASDDFVERIYNPTAINTTAGHNLSSN